MSHVFISYSTKNSDFAHLLANRLKEQGFDVWIDNSKLRSGDNWWEKIVKAIHTCSAFVVVVTPEAKDSKWVQREVTLADNWNKPIFPVLLSGENWEIFVLTQYEDVRTGTCVPVARIAQAFFERVAEVAPHNVVPGKDRIHDTLSEATDDQLLLKEIANPPIPETGRVISIRSGFLVSAFILSICAVGVFMALSHQRNQLPRAVSTIYLTRIINPPIVLEAGATSLTTIWLKAQGDATYIVDSIEDKGQILCPFTGAIPSGALPPDAQYKFDLEELVEMTPLNPAIRLSPEDPREISFTLGLSFSPDHYCYSSPIIRIHYHRNDGVTGTLLLVDTPSNAQFVGNLLDTNIEFKLQSDTFEGKPGDSLIVSPNGIQLGYDSTISALLYESLELPNLSLDDLEKAKADVHFPDRIMLNERIIYSGVVPTILENLMDGKDAAFDLCAGLLLDECEKALIEALQKDKLFEPAITALAIRHLIKPSKIFETAILDHLVRFLELGWYEYPFRERLIKALIVPQHGNWLATLSQIASSPRDNRQTCDLLVRIKGQLAPSQAADIDRFCPGKG